MECACDCSADYDPPAIVREAIHWARKTYICCECGEQIKPGQRYERADGKWDKYWSTYATCMPCLAIRKAYCPQGWVYGELLETISECLGLDYITGDMSCGRFRCFGVLKPEDKKCPRCGWEP